jgi:ribosomal protein S1
MESAPVDWEGVRKAMPVGASVAGTVVGRRPYGVWVDVGVGVTALLLVTRIRRTGVPIRADGYQGYPAMGDQITARVLNISEQAGTIALTQLDSDE